jgi:uncharacterized protein (DUF983 family)
MDMMAGTRFNVTRGQILARGLVGCCPNCGNRSLFPDHSLRIREACPVCELVFDPGGGFWLGPWAINYYVSAVVIVCPLIVLGVREVIPMTAAIVLAVVLGAFVMPLAFYRLSWGWWLGIYYCFFPHRLPENFAHSGFGAGSA